MKLWMRSSWIVWLLSCSGCTGDAVSVGDLRCAGRDVRCERPMEREVGNYTLVDTTVLAEQSAALRWQSNVPCSGDMCRAWSWPAPVTHADGSVTLAQTHHHFDKSGNRLVRQDVWIGHFSADGDLLWQDESIGDDAPHDVNDEYDVALALDERGDVLMAADRRLGSGSELAVYEGDRELSLYRMSESGKPVRLFRTEGLQALGAIAVAGDDVLIAGYYWTQSLDDAPNPEVARYHRDGTLVWRQSRLRLHEDSELAQDNKSFPDTTPISLAVDSQGHAFTIVQEYRGTSLVAVDGGGNVLWGMSPGTLETRDNFAYQLPALVLDSEDRLLVAGNSMFGQQPLQLARITPNATVQRAPITNAVLGQDAGLPQLMSGLARDAVDRVIVAMVGGTSEEPRYAIQRNSEDLTRREPFSVPGLEVPVVFSDPSKPPTGLDLHGIRVGQNGDVYYWGSSELGRIALPE